MQEIVGNEVNTMNKLQETIEKLTEDNKKLRLTIEQYQELLDNLQSTSNQISLSYDHTINTMKNKYEEEIRRLLQSNNQFQSQVNSLKAEISSYKNRQNNNNTNNNAVPSSKQFKNFSEAFSKLEELRLKHRQTKPEPSITLEEVQEQKIHQLLEEISILESLVKDAGIFDKFRNAVNIEQLQKDLDDSRDQLRFCEREKSALLDAIESGDLTAFAELQKEAQERKKQQIDVSANNEMNTPNNTENPAAVSEEQSSISILLNDDDEPKIEVVGPVNNSKEEKPQKKKRGWFW